MCLTRTLVVQHICHHIPRCAQFIQWDPNSVVCSMYSSILFGVFFLEKKEWLLTPRWEVLLLLQHRDREMRLKSYLLLQSFPMRKILEPHFGPKSCQWWTTLLIVPRIKKNKTKLFQLPKPKCWIPGLKFLVLAMFLVQSSRDNHEIQKTWKASSDTQSSRLEWLSQKYICMHTKSKAHTHTHRCCC